MTRQVTEIGLATCADCGHGRSEHEYCSEMYPALCVHPTEGWTHDDDPWEACCPCLNFVTEKDVAHV